MASSQDYPHGKSIFRSSTFWNSLSQLAIFLVLIGQRYIETGEITQAELALLFAEMYAFSGAVSGRSKALQPAYTPKGLPGLDKDELLAKVEADEYAALRLEHTPQADPVDGPPDISHIPTGNTAADEIIAELPDDASEDDKHEKDLGLLEFVSPENVKFKVQALQETRLKASIEDSSQLAATDWRMIPKGHKLDVLSWKQAESQHLKLGFEGAHLFVYQPHVELLDALGNPVTSAQPAETRPSRPIRLGNGQTVDLNDPIIPNGNFTWSEATRGGTRIPVNQGIVDGIIRIAKVMQEIRAIFDDRPITVNSWYRDPATNRRVGGATRSRHLEGDAVDFVVSGMHPRDVHRRLNGWWGSRGGLASATVFTHIDARGYSARWSYNF